MILPTAEAVGFSGNPFYRQEMGRAQTACSAARSKLTRGKGLVHCHHEPLPLIEAGVSDLHYIMSR
jgi:hypothetical protein